MHTCKRAHFPLPPTPLLIKGSRLIICQLVQLFCKSQTDVQHHHTEETALCRSSRLLPWDLAPASSVWLAAATKPGARLFVFFFLKKQKTKNSSSHPSPAGLQRWVWEDGGWKFTRTGGRRRSQSNRKHLRMSRAIDSRWDQNLVCLI